MDRRLFVRSGVVGFTALTIPGWLAGCRREEPLDVTSDPISALLDRSASRDVLVFHVEDDRERATDLGHLIGVFLARGSDVELSRLAEFEIVCRTSVEFRGLAPALAHRADVRAVLIGRDRSVRVAIAGDPPSRLRAAGGYDFEDILHEARITQRNAWLVQQIDDAVGRDEATLERRAIEERSLVPGWSDHTRPTVENARRWPRSARFRAVHLANTEYRDWMSALARVVDSSLIQRPPEGSAWATTLGCGMSWDAPPSGRRTNDGRGVACGMGHVPEASQRFLHFYTREELGS